MKTDHLHGNWSGPDNSRLVSKQFSFRLPVHVAAKISALADMYPSKNRTQIVADLLTAALDDLEKTLPYSKGESVEDVPFDTTSEYFYIEGPRQRFRELTEKYFNQLESELGNPNPAHLFSDLILPEKDFGSK